MRTIIVQAFRRCLTAKCCCVISYSRVFGLFAPNNRMDLYVGKCLINATTKITSRYSVVVVSGSKFSRYPSVPHSVPVEHSGTKKHGWLQP